MSERIRGLSIGLDLDSADVTKSIWDIRRSFRDLNSSLQTNMNNFKSTERSVSSYTTAMEDLDDAVVKQRKNVDDLKAKYDETVKTKGENSRAAQNLRQEYNRQVDSLNKLESELSDVTAEYKTFVEEQRIANSEFTKLGNELQTAGTRLQSFGSGLSGVGANLTKYITAPIVGATTALAGLTAGLGWKRLMDLDTATASLRGRGYNEEEIARINEDILEGVTGGMATRAEGTRVASGALSAGIAEGEDLQDYIRLVDAATIASGGRRSIDDTAQIFNRIVSGGRMMTQELNMIEDTMPGFSNTMAEHLGVASDEFRKMVTEGEVSSDDFLVVMENFAGDMAEEYANTLPGMLSNARANLGIFGENMMRGVYEETREVVADLLDVLRSDEARELATSLGETIGEAFRKIVAAIRSAIDWYINLDDNQRKVVNGLAMFVVALGPLLTILGTGIVIFGKIATGLGAISLAFGKAGSVSALFRSAMAGLLSPIRVLLRPLLTLGTRFFALSNPIGWVVTGLTALGVGFYQAYKHSESFREFVDGIVLSLKGAWEWLVTFKDGIVALFRGEDAIEIFESLGLSEEAIDSVSGWVDTVMETFEELKETFSEVYESISESLRRIWESVKTIFTQIIDFLGIDVEAVIESLKEAWANLKEWFKDDFIEQAFTAAKVSVDIFGETIEGLLATADRVFEGVADALESISEGDWKGAWEDVKEMFSDIGAIWTDVWNNIKETIDDNFGDTIESVKNWAIDLWDTIKEWFNTKSLEVTAVIIGWYLGILNWWDNLKNELSIKTEVMWNVVKGWFETKTREIIGTIAGWYLSLTGWWDNIKQAVSEKSEQIWSSAKEWFDKLPDAMSDALSRVGQTISGWTSTLSTKATNLGKGIANGVIDGLNWMIRKINQVAGWLGVDSLISEISRIGMSSGGSSAGVGRQAISAYSSGTNFHKGGLALVGDRGPGNSPGGSGSGDRSVTRELIKLPNQMELLADGNLLLDLPTGSKVMNNRDTEEELKKRALGISHGGGWFEDLTNDILSNIITGAANDAKEGRETGRLTSVARGVGATAQYTTRKLGDFASDLWSYASNPGQLFEEIFNNLVNNHLNVPSTFFPLAVGGIGKLKDAVADYIGGLFTKSDKADGRYILNKSISHGFGGYNAVPGSILFGRNHYGIDTRHNYDDLYSPVSGHVSKTWYDAMGGNSIQVSQGNGRTWWFMHMNNNAVRAGQSVSVGDYLGKTGNTGSFTTGPHLHTQVMEGGIGNSYAIDPFPILNSHRLGGLTESAGLFNLHENEMIVPLNNPTQAMKLIALAGRKLAGRSKQTSELPNVSNNDGVIEKLVEQNSILMKMLEKLTGIEAKDLKIGDDAVGQANDRYSARQSSKQSVTTGRMRYV